MSKRMMIRILSVSIALLFLGVFLPSLTNGAVNPTDVQFGEVEVGTQVSQFLSISNSNPGSVQVMMFISYVNGADCGFSLAYEGSALTPDASTGYIYLPGELEGGGSVNVEVIFAPTDPAATCTASLMVVAGGFAKATLSGTGVKAPELKNIIIDGQDTNVLDFKYKNMRFSEWLDVIAAEARNHGQYVKLVAFWARRAHKAGNLEKEEIKAIVKAAIHAKIPKEGVITGKKEKHHGRRHAAGFGSHGGHHK